MTERQKMISGQLYKSGVKELVNDRILCKEQCYDFNGDSYGIRTRECMRERHVS